MKYIRKWDLPALDEPTIEHLEKIPGWGENYFWYCVKCRQIYASVILHPEDCSHRIWRGLGGLCLTCIPHKYLIRGELNSAVLIGLEVPYEVIAYILDREIDFIGHPAHPHNSEYEI